MSTRCYVGKENENGTVRMVYVHCDGHPTTIGPVLLWYYSDDNLDKLLDLGALDCISTTIQTCKSFHRDYGEPKQIEIVESVTKAITFGGSGIEWVHIRRKNGEWESYNCRNCNERIPLAIALERTGIDEEDFKMRIRLIHILATAPFEEASDIFNKYLESF